MRSNVNVAKRSATFSISASSFSSTCMCGVTVSEVIIRARSEILDDLLERQAIRACDRRARVRLGQFAGRFIGLLRVAKAMDEPQRRNGYRSRQGVAHGRERVQGGHQHVELSRVVQAPVVVNGDDYLRGLRGASAGAESRTRETVRKSKPKA